MVLETHTDPKRQSYDGGLTVINTLLDDNLHTLYEEQPQKNDEVGPGHGTGDGHQQGRKLGEECQSQEYDADGNTHSPSGDSRDLGKGNTG